MPTKRPTVAAKLGPFNDCTSNQAIAFAELNKLDDDEKPVYKDLIAESLQVAHWLFGKQTDATLEELAVELMVCPALLDNPQPGRVANIDNFQMVNLSLRMASHTTGYLHVQTDPRLAYSTQRTIKNAESKWTTALPLLIVPTRSHPRGIISHFKQLAPGFDTSRVCIKIPATWEGVQACRELEQKGITTLATVVVSLEQTALAAAAGCRYIAPYVNELRVHFDSRYCCRYPYLPRCPSRRANRG